MLAAGDFKIAVTLASCQIPGHFAEKTHRGHPLTLMVKGTECPFTQGILPAEERA